MARANKGYEIRPMVCDWALDIPMGDAKFVLYFNSRNNAELVKAVLEWEDAHPNEATPYQPTLTPPNEWVSVEERLPEHCKILVTDGKKVVLSNGAWIYRSREGELRVPASYGAGLTVTHWMYLPEPPDRRPPEGEVDA